jgi:flagellar hook protein FlgE
LTDVELDRRSLMSVLTSLYTGISGMKAQGEALNVIGDNIANANTTGFKSSRVEFQDIVSKSLKGIEGGNQIGRGVKIGAVNPILLQGTVDHTDRVTDLAVSGDGYFVVRGSDGQTFTRDGSFAFDKNGYLKTNDHQLVQGFKIDEKSRVTAEMGNIQFPQALIPAKGTEKIEMHLNLDSKLPVGPKFDIKNPHDTSQFSTSVEMYDSQGTKHLVYMHFNKTADRTWEYNGLVDGSEVTGGKAGEFARIVGGKITFNEYGVLNTEEQTFNNFNFAGGAFPNQKVIIDFGDSIVTDKTKGEHGTKQYGSASDLHNWKQDGYSAGTIISLSFNDEGTLSAQYSNGNTKDLFQIALAKFENSEGLFKSGNNRFKESKNSGTPAIGRPGSNGRGQIYSKSLERSTVDLANEFVNLIQNQRSFQANAKTISTTDQLLEEIINIKR